MDYINRVYENLKQKYGYEPEFLQAVQEVLESIRPAVMANLEVYEKNKILERLTTPDRIISFRVPWVNDKGEVEVNMGYRVQWSSAIGPYKGGLRLHPSVNQSILKFFLYLFLFALK